MAKKVAVSKGKTALVKWDAELAQFAKEGVDQVASIGSGTGIKFGRGTITVGGLTIPGGKLECIIIGSCALNAWYGKDYDKDDIQPPDCYAMAAKSGDKEMAPHADAVNPQAETCATCKKNEFGTAKTGRGKACGNNIRLGVIVAKDAEDGESTASAELATGKLSPTNTKHWAGYVKMLKQEYERPPWGVVTEIASYDDPDTQIRLEFRMVEVIEDGDILSALKKRYLGIQEILQVPFTAAAPKATGKGKKVNGKLAGKQLRGRK